MYSKFIAYLLWLFSGFGWLGFHRFYLGKPFSGILWICTGGLAGIGSIYDLITLGRQVDYENLRLAQNKAAGYVNRHFNEQGMRYADDASTRIVGDFDANDTIERKILKLARRNNRVLTASEVAIEADLPLDTAKKQLENMTTHGHAEMRVRKSGAIVFTFPEFMDTDSPIEDF